MKTIEQLLATNKAFHVDSLACMQHALTLKLYKRPVEKHPWSEAPKHVQLTFKVAFISICHQFNWDFLQLAIAKNTILKRLDFIEILENVTAKEISDWLSDYPKKDRIRAKERSSLLRNVGHVLRQEFKGDMLHFYDCCAQASLKDGDFHALMEHFDGYRTDPLQKKTNVLTHDLVKENILNFCDEENIRPAVDYHIMRLYLRTGRVIPADPAVFSFLRGAPNPRGSLVKQLRQAVSDAEILTAYYAGLNVADVNYIEWQIGRSICHNKNPDCLGPDNKPSGIPHDVAALFQGSCPYKAACLSFNNLSFDQRLKFIEFEEPNYISTHY